ncbi:heterokaryon incompatibility protein-domain-containing protein [Colletotrichum cereale]|nr:heterokaryon incompatibility protein-domain-containing protein [Colletotrichum cereale]
MSLSDYTLAFLSGLGASYDDEDVDNIWRGRIFPLVRTDDFATNWMMVSDPNGSFITSSGSRCRVDPQPHHSGQCQSTVHQDNGPRQVIISYQAVVFAKVAHRISLQTILRSRSQPAIVGYRRFLNDIASKLPRQWRDLIIHCDVHLYNEQQARRFQPIEVQHYAPLANTENIRLLEILPNVISSALVECTLREAGPPEASAYQALSYVWGTEDATKSILLNGTTFPVRPNLEAVLRQLRPRGSKPRVMWIDAICINQFNTQERNEQVAQMDSVYENADSVEVWLGRESITSSRLFDALDHARQTANGLEQFLKSPHFLGFPFQPEPYCPDFNGVPSINSRLMNRHLASSHLVEPAKVRELQIKVQELEAVRHNPLGLPHRWTEAHINVIEAFVKLLDRSWWSRVWVLQEVILANKITLHCGARSVDWAFFQGILYTLVHKGKRSMIHHRGGVFCNSRQARAHDMLLHKAIMTLPFFFLQAASFFAKTIENLSLANLMSLSFSFEATDPRDRIFALIGLLPTESNERLTFKPDYSISVKKLFVRIAKYFIQTTGRLDVITARPSISYFHAVRFRSLVEEDRGVGLHGMREFYSPKSQSTATTRHSPAPSWVPNWEITQSWQFNSIWISEFSPLATFDLYMQVRQRAVQRETESIPSVPDSTPGLTEHTHKRHQLFNASLSERTLFSPSFSACDEILRVQGVTIDVVSAVGQPWDLAYIPGYDPGTEDKDQAINNMHNAQVAIIESWKVLAGLEGNETYPFSSQPYKEAFWRTLFLDRYSDNSINSKRSGILSFHRLPGAHETELMAQVFAPLGITCNFPPQNNDDETYLIYYLRHEAAELWRFASLNLHCVDLSFFKTAKGYIGVGHPNTQPGDKVVVLSGALVPLTLREFPEGHVLIGESYVHGIMDGEAIQTREDNDFELFSII